MTTALSQEPANPYRNAAVGDWLKYEVKAENTFRPYQLTLVLRVTAIEGDIVTVTHQTTTKKEQAFQYNKTFERTTDRSKPIPLLDFLGYDKPHELPMEKTDQGA